MSADEWLQMVRALCAQHAPNKAALLFRAMNALRDVPPGELRPRSRIEEALDSIKALLGCGRHDGGVDDVRLLFAASQVVPRHSQLWASASRSRALEPAITALLNPCASADATYKDKVLVSQMAVMQPKLQYICHTFWQALAKNGTAASDARATATILNVYAKLVSQQQGADTDTGNKWHKATLFVKTVGWG
jgi:hypothetical protein